MDNFDLYLKSHADLKKKHSKTYTNHTLYCKETTLIYTLKRRTEYSNSKFYLREVF